MPKTIITIEAIEAKPLPTGVEHYNIKAIGKGYFGMFKEDLRGRRIPGVDDIEEGATGEVEYFTKANPQNSKYPFKTITAFHKLDKDSEFAFGKTPDKSKFLEEWKEYKEKVDTLWREKEFREDETEGL